MFTTTLTTSQEEEKHFLNYLLIRKSASLALLEFKNPITELLSLKGCSSYYTNTVKVLKLCVGLGPDGEDR